ncbi:UNVERIFIED_CONTAM: hypothetical protein HHA_452780 [Hammondia hammondi]|eukprot:XP_008886003.1 hypothetical protein HHA_452780 [Hammondia hammondi]
MRPQDGSFDEQKRPPLDNGEAAPSPFGWSIRINFEVMPFPNATRVLQRRAAFSPSLRVATI